MPTSDALYGLFPEDPDQPELSTVTPEEMPESYRRLLVHSHHMTVTVEEYYGQPVNVKVLDSVQHGQTYGRKILLSLKDTDEVVQFGIVRVNLGALSETVRSQIVAGQTPLGRVLIQNNVLRSIQPTEFFRVALGPKLSGWFGLDAPRTTYGRLGVIFTGGVPAVEVLEILAPLPATRTPAY